MSFESIPEQPGATEATESPSPAGDAGGEAVCVVILGETVDGKRFRPSDWNERLHGTLRALDEEEYQACHDFVHLTTLGGRKCVQVDCRLREEDERLFDFFLHFARDNNLQMRELTKAELEKARRGESD